MSLQARLLQAVHLSSLLAVERIRIAWTLVVPGIDVCLHGLRCVDRSLRDECRRLFWLLSREFSSVANRGRQRSKFFSARHLQIQ